MARRRRGFGLAPPGLSSGGLGAGIRYSTTFRSSGMFPEAESVIGTGGVLYNNRGAVSSRLAEQPNRSLHFRAYAAQRGVELTK